MKRSSRCPFSNGMTASSRVVMKHRGGHVIPLLAIAGKRLDRSEYVSEQVQRRVLAMSPAHFLAPTA